MRSLSYAILTDGWNDPGWSAPAPDQPSGTSDCDVVYPAGYGIVHAAALLS